MTALVPAARSSPRRRGCEPRWPRPTAPRSPRPLISGWTSTANTTETSILVRLASSSTNCPSLPDQRTPNLGTGARGSGTADPFAGAVGEPLVFPDGHRGLELINQRPAGVQRLGAVRAGHRHEHRRCADRQVADAMHGGDPGHLELPVQRLPWSRELLWWRRSAPVPAPRLDAELVPRLRSEEHTSELQSLRHLVCRLLLEK